jgi:hypothetical protein
MEITKEQLEQAIANLATQDDLKNVRDEVILANRRHDGQYRGGLGA